MSRVALVASAAVLTLSACADDGGQESTAPTDRSTTGAAEPDEGRLYEQALARYEECLEEVAPFYAEGRASAASAKAFDACWVDGAARQEELSNLESNGISFASRSEVLWSRPGTVTDGRVTIEQCVTDGTVLKDGEELPPAGPGHPYELHVTLVEASGAGFKIEDAQPVLDGEEYVPCDEE